MNNTSQNTIYIDLIARLNSAAFKRVRPELDDIDRAINKSEKEAKKRQLMMEKAAMSAEKSIVKSIGSKKKQAVATDNLGLRTAKYDEINKRFGTNQSGTNKILAAAGRQIADNGDMTDLLGNSVDDGAKGLDKYASAGSKFQMAHLGVMFAGMALQRTMSGLNSTAREWVGMNELMSTAMGITMLPATMDLLELGVLPLFDALTSLPEEAQTAIGYTTIALEGLGGVMMTGGQLLLGVGAFKSLFPAAFAKVATVTGSVVSLTSALTILGVAVAAIAFGTWIQGLADASKAYNDLGDDILAVNEILGQEGQETRQTTHGLSEEDSASVAALTTSEALGYGDLPLSNDTSSLTPISDYGIELPELQDSSDEKSGFSAIIDWLTGTNGSMAVGGNIRESGNYYLHQGEEVIPKNDVQSGGINMVVTYNVTVSDKKEFESMLKTNNSKMTSELRRISIA